MLSALTNINFETYKFRKVYLRPTLIGGERLLIGIVIQFGTELRPLILQSPSVLKTIEFLYGVKGRDRYLYAIAQLQDEVAGADIPLGKYGSPNTALMLGESEVFAADDPLSKGWDFIRSASTLCMGETGRIPQRKLESISHVDLLSNLNREVSRMDLMTGTRLFQGHEFGVGSRKIRVPICGSKVIGAPISFVSSKIENAKNYGEASIAKLIFAHRLTNQTPVLYVLLPQLGSLAYSKMEEAFGEFSLLAESSDMKIRSDSSIQNLAQSVLFDEKAA